MPRRLVGMFDDRNGGSSLEIETGSSWSSSKVAGISPSDDGEEPKGSKRYLRSPTHIASLGFSTLARYDNSKTYNLLFKKNYKTEREGKTT
jgi:hypothetical protein